MIRFFLFLMIPFNANAAWVFIPDVMTFNPKAELRLYDAAGNRVKYPFDVMPIGDVVIDPLLGVQSLAAVVTPPPLPVSAFVPNVFDPNTQVDPVFVVSVFSFVAGLLMFAYLLGFALAYPFTSIIGFVKKQKLF